MRLLLVEDDDRVASAIEDVLTRHGYTVERAGDAAAALVLLGPLTDVVVLDLTLPDSDGFDLCARIRSGAAGCPQVPIIMATARGDLGSRVHGLRLGADDYLVKPFDLRELMARVEAVARRAQRADGQDAGPVAAGRALIDVPARTVLLDGSVVQLTRKEFDLLAVLAQQRGAVVRREVILGAVWQVRDAAAARTLEVHVASIRAKTAAPALIETVRGVGYRLGAA